MGGQEMIMNRKLKDGRYLHINQEYGWYIDKEEKYKQNILPNNKIQRSREKINFFDYPNIYLLSGCNGKCKYCYQNEHFNVGNMNLKFEDIREFIHNIKDKQSKNHKKYIELFGGEPLLRKDIIDIIGFLKDEGYVVNIATNGTPEILRNDQFINVCKENVHIRISLDGHNSKLHEKYRTPNTFEKIVENIKYIRSENISVSIKSIITDHNYPYIEEILHFVKEELKVNKWNYNVLYNLEACKKNGITSNITHLTMVKELCNDKYEQFYPMMKQTPFCQMLIKVFTRTSPYYLRTYPFLNYDGNLFINDQLIVPEYKIGSIEHIKSNWINLVNEIEYERESCKKCINKNFCYLGNYGELYKIDKKLKMEFPTCNTLRLCIFTLMEQNEKGLNILKSILEG